MYENYSNYIELRMQDLVREAESERRLKEAIQQAKVENPRRPLRAALGERLILLGWRLMNQTPAEGETCSRLMLSGPRQAIVMVEVCV